MNNYNIYFNEETEAAEFKRIARSEGAIITAVSGCGTGYYIQLDATEKQAARINKRIGG